MKSKISFFNKTIFWKNVSLYWPIWGIYGFFVLVYQPIVLTIVNESAKGYPYSAAQRFEDLVSCLYLENSVTLIAITAVIAGMALYSYLYNHQILKTLHLQVHK